MAKKTKKYNWEAEGLGKAPYRFVGQDDTAAGANADGLVRILSTDGLEHWTKPGGSCAVCGTYISVFYNFVSADGIRFHVGCECAEQASLPYVELTKVQRAKKQHSNKLRWAREVKKVEELTQLIKANDFSDEPHPAKWAADKGQTYQDYVNWMFDNCGNSGKIKLLKQLKAKVGVK